MNKYLLVVLAATLASSAYAAEHNTLRGKATKHKHTHKNEIKTQAGDAPENPPTVTVPPPKSEMKVTNDNKNWDALGENLPYPGFDCELTTISRPRC